MIRSAFVMALLSAPLSRGAAQPKPDPLAGLPAYIERVRQDWKIPGVAVGIVKDDSLVFAAGFGVKELGKPDSVTPRTLFAIGSNTKSFTSTAAAMLVDDGKLRWNDRVTKWLPGFELYDVYVTRDLTVRDVLSHRSGLGRRGDALWYGTRYSREEILQRIRFLKPNAGFRTEMGYQNIMFLAGGQVVGKAAGTSYDEVIRTRIFKPLGMSTSGVVLGELKGQSDVSTPHAIRPTGATVIPWRNLDNVAPAGSINSNVVEMAQYLRLHLGNGTYRGTRLVSMVNLGITKTPHVNAGGVGDSLSHFSSYGLGWVLQDYRGKKIAWHNGGIDGQLSEMWTIPEVGLGIVVLSNGSPHAAGPAIVWNIVDRYLMGGPTKDYLAEGLKQSSQIAAMMEARDKKLETDRVKDTQPSLPLERYAGSYADAMYGDVEVLVEGGKLVLDWQGSRVPLAHWHYNTFRGELQAGAPTMITFQIGPTGKVAVVDVDGLAAFAGKSARR
jgi:CubicO group peptidase (beta-lactamase class C family)